MRSLVYASLYEGQFQRGYDRLQASMPAIREPTDLPEGTEVELLAADEIDELDPAERAKLYGFLAESIRTHVPGTGTSAAAVLAELRNR